MLGADPSPLEIIQATRNGRELPLGGAFKSDSDLLSDTIVRVRNASKEEIKSARLTIDWIDPQSGKTFAALCSLEASNLAPGAERAGKVTEIKAEGMRKGIAQAGRASLRLLVRVDMVELANNTTWQYGVLLRRDPNDPNKRVPVSPNGRIGMREGKATVQNASLRIANSSPSVGSLSWCAYWDYIPPPPPHWCDSCSCNIYYDEYTYTPNALGQFLFDIIPQGCGGYGWWECPGCYKQSIVGYC
ncbi:MAG: hypothetical protein ACREBD_14965 [Blastocatellia bacterium]